MKVQIVNMSMFRAHKERPEMTANQVIELYHAYVCGTKLDAMLDVDSGDISVYLGNDLVIVPARFVQTPFNVTESRFNADFISSGCIVNEGKRVIVVMSSDRTPDGIKNTLQWASPNCDVTRDSHMKTERGNWYRIELDFNRGIIGLSPTTLRY
ncbi:hypothetical protein Aeh1ORF055c [Aeromonas phage Aeh1]|uniref:Uncharacterized protein n=1 Tax=Aeromonas phage Aeh1 TaxID=2880362 RepID=Q76Z31_9CAUD|nr:hypothetical protein Aeh1p060 [Aeromonas phage Aeh1]AAQ17715.1 hypothetical protein Aeh1ORF055c [Aeromonas phage Aeh1]